MGNWRCSLPSVEVMSRKGRECRATKPGETNRNQPSEDRDAEGAPERRKGTSDSRGEKDALQSLGVCLEAKSQRTV